MFSRDSRYFPLPEAVAVDARGRRLVGKELRLLPRVEGTFLHTLEDGDRLDHLAHKYYREPRLWWRVCDANPDPDVASPWALVDQEPLETWRFPFGLGDAAARPPWNALERRVGALRGVTGVTPVEVDVELVEDENLPVNEDLPEDERVENFVPRFERALVVRFNRLSTSLDEIAAVVEEVMTAAGLEVAAPRRLGRVGKAVVIPPRTG